ncbi:MAG: hypothetical protein EA412_01985 [Chitinophagaceae bacterium]|nr:MAG: hypothetical protein EA412_01985 [Chitinophagaceae bacterium]
MKHICLILILLFSIIYITACESEMEKKTEDAPKTEESMPFDLYEPSQMAALMHAMEADLKKMKATLKAGDVPEFPVSWEGIFHAELTNPSQGDDLFYEKSEQFIDLTIESVEKMKKGSEFNPELYNLIVASCIDCHQSYCPGPIRRIEKLKWKDHAK